jgi:hypothetical protein
MDNHEEEPYADEPFVLADEEDINEVEDAPDPASVAEAATMRAEFSHVLDDEEASPDGPAAESAETAENAENATSFAHLDPKGVVPRKLLSEALAFFQANQARFPKRSHISILDYSLRSTEPRFHVIDMASGQVTSLRMSNGVGSEPVHDGFARTFGNKPGSNMSSLGFAKTAETYHGKHGLSLRLDGLSSTNSNLRPRAVVVHGAKYVRDAAVVQGRSNGCPALPMAQKDKIIGLIKGGTMLYAGLSKG